jgi:hypothetical protein
MDLPDPSRRDVPAGGAVQFDRAWDVPAELEVSDIEVEHFWVRAGIDRL